MSSTNAMLSSLTGSIGLPEQNVGVPGMMPEKPGGNFGKDFIVKYFKGCLDNPEDLIMAEDIETKALDPQKTGIVLLESQRYIFGETCYLVLKYLKRKDK